MYHVLKYIHENIHEKLSVAQTAEQYGYSKWHFIRSFKRFTGKSFVDYVRHYKMQNAAFDLLDGKKAIDVAISCGYDTPGGFNKAFLKEFGCLPREFLKKNKESILSYKERRDTMYKMTDRCEHLRTLAMSDANKKEICMQKEFWMTKGMSECPTNDNMLALGYGIGSIIENHPPLINKGELIVGYNYCDEFDYAVGDVALMKEFMPEQAEEYAVCFENIQRFTVNKIPPYSQKERWLDDEWAAIGRCIDTNHTVINYADVLALGFEGLIEKIDGYEAQNGSSSLYTAARMICEKACALGEKYAKEAIRMMENDDLTPEMKEELKQIAKVCRTVPAKPATTFWEAVQSLWFAHIINTWEDGINANSLGRLDQILYPYYQKDIEAGIITKEFAFELICCLWIKLYRSYDVQQSVVGGVTPDGSDAVNELSYMMLDATEELDFIRCLSVRYNQNTEKAFVRRALEVVGHLQKGVPFFFNDDVMIPSLTGAGIALEDARDYTQIGCVETVIPGKSNPHAVTGETNLLKALEYALLDGKSMMDDSIEPGIRTGKITTYEELKKAVYLQIENILDVCCKIVLDHTKLSETAAPKPYKSLLTQGCMEQNKDFNNHGALYDYYQIMLGGVPNLADSMMVLKKFVFTDKKYTLDEVVAQLKADYPNELMRLEFLNKSPKFGNDIDEVDEIAAEIINVSCDILERLSEKYGLSFHPQPFTYLWMIDHGKQTGATPDGRHKGEVIAYSVSPMQGRDFNGFTPLINSLCKLPTTRTPGTTSAIVEVDPKLFTDNNIDKFTDIMFAAAEKGLSNVQFNVVDAETLMDAQKHPEKYNNLAVRVSGFSQKFNLLDEELQNHIIGRTKHTCM